MSDTSHPAPLPPERLRRTADLASLAFQSTAELTPFDGFTGQERALGAVRLGSAIEKPGYNLFAIGQPGLAMQQAVETMLREASAAREAPPDWVYVNNFTEPHKPVAIRLPAGRAAKLGDALRELIEDLKATLPAAFESEDYQKRRGAMDEAFQKKQAASFKELNDKAALRGLVLLRTPLGFAFAPAKNGQVVSPDEFHKWDEAARLKVEEAMHEMEKELEHIVQQMPAWEKARREEVRKLNRDTANFAVGRLIDETKAKFSDLPQVQAHFEAVRRDLVDNVGMFVGKNEGDEGPVPTTLPGGPFDRYDINVFVANDPANRGVPVVHELHPTLGNLTGRIEYLSMQGALVTNFRLIKPGALHRANGGYLLLDVRALLAEPFSWTALKRVLKRGEIVIEDASHFLGLASTVTLEPDPIPLDLKIVLFGERILYYLLAQYDPEMTEHFKILVDFEDDFERSPKNESAYAKLIAAMAMHDKLRPLQREAVGLVIEQAARLADDSGKLTLVTDQIRNLIVEADHWAAQSSRKQIEQQDVQYALDQQIWRASRIRDRDQEMILDNIALIETTGQHVGQINGLSVMELGGFRFGRPTRITCRVRPGSGNVIDIEREVKLGGPIHSKGVLILSGFLAGRYALDAPMSLFASLVFEQSYGGVEGDSASSAELYTLLSALAEAPLRQDIAVTGSINQHGEIQAIGGVNEKIEGFFDICRKRGLTGTQGVAIPASNVRHLMLRQDVVEACKAGQFAIYPIATADEGITLLTGLSAEALNSKVEQRLKAFAKIRQRFGEAETKAKPDDTP
ncbi:Lon protease family protein [Acidocella aromatica]|uniref:endopeptidase La n=1 Tax=Acidocella aromatica TaxID=1303579 RepID=A0A840VQP8_9PROT|nr:AAA family ATPase [Acidocella aromatica]MBB5373921.1 putative ATP-dependent protease [Acidocella aromatica]